MKAPVLKTGRRESVSWVRIPPHPPPHCSLKFADVLFYQLKQLVIDDSCSTRYAFICANSRRSVGTNDGTDYEDGWLTSLNARFVETTLKVRAPMNNYDIVSPLSKSINELKLNHRQFRREVVDHRLSFFRVNCHSIHGHPC